MRVWQAVVAAVGLSFILAACAKPPQRIPEDEPEKARAAVSAYLAQEDAPVMRAAYEYTDITGRTLHVASEEDIALRDGEVVLTFDDGPSPTYTPRILDALDEAAVKATFFTVGQMARAHPEVLQDVALRGHTVGTHTNDHTDLAAESVNAAMTSVNAGYHAAAGALAPIGTHPSPFFRFPYLSETRALRVSLSDEHMVVLDVDIDSKDYTDRTPGEVLTHTLERLEAEGKGIVLFHDIQARTAELLPDFLEELGARDYEVVHLVPDRRGLFDRALVTAGLRGE